MTADRVDLGPPTVTVRGHGSVRIQPDEAVLGLTLTALKDSAGSAVSDVAARSEALSELLDGAGVPREARTTTGITAREEFDYTERGRRSLGHRASAHVAVRVRDPAVIGAIVARAAEEVGARIRGPDWEVAQTNPAHAEAARAASADARRRADAYAAGLGLTVGALLRLTEPDSEPISHFSAEAMAATGGEESEMPVHAGEHEVRAAIDATFALEVASEARD